MKNIEIEDKAIFDKYKNPNILNSEYQFTTLFAWAKRYNFCYQEHEDTLLIFGNQNDGSLQCYYPLGNQALKSSIEYIKYIFKEEKAPLNLRPLSEDMLNSILPYMNKNCLIGTKKSYSDYICDYQKLVNYSGPEYKRKRKLVNAFYKRYNFKYERLTADKIDFVKSGLYDILSDSKNVFDIDEWYAYLRILNNIEKLELRGGMILVDNKLEAICIAEEFYDSIIIHIRRCNKSFVGIYPAMLQLLLQHEFCDKHYKYVNLQDDMGIENLRKAKFSYKPVFLLEKYYIKEEF